MGGRAAKSLLAAGALAALAVAGCDLQEGADTENGRQLFVEQCGSCHILQEAGTSGNLGPDLDAAFANARAVGMDNDTIEGVVTQQIGFPRFTEPDDPAFMPADLVSGQDADDVATYIAEVAGVPGIQPPEAPGGPGGQVFADNGCGACHVLQAAQSTGTVGPDLDQVLPGMSAQEIEESIVDPDSILTAGFAAGVMPADYGETIPPEDLELLVQFLLENAGQAGDGGGGNGGGGG